MTWTVADDSPLLAGLDHQGRMLWRAVVSDWLRELAGLRVDVRPPRDGEPEMCAVPGKHRKQLELARQYADRALHGFGIEDGYGREVKV